MRREYNCTHCDKKYSYAYLLELHQKIHETSHRSSSSAPKAPRNGMVKCHICSEMFPDMKTLIAHSTTTHENDKPYVCRTCGKGLTTKFAFQRHERMHTNERPYACSFCDKAFLDSESRRAHQRIHTGEKPYKCQFCDRTFSRSGNLQSHILTHTGEKPCICPVCNRGFAQHATLKGHLRTHGYEEIEREKKKLKRKTKSDEDNSKEIKRLLLGKSSEMKKAVTSIRYERAAENTYDEYEDDDDNVVLVMQ